MKKAIPKPHTQNRRIMRNHLMSLMISTIIAITTAVERKILLK
jgi:hypothetical protein